MAGRIPGITIFVLRAATEYRALSSDLIARHYAPLWRTANQQRRIESSYSDHATRSFEN
ncbi:hypothetical protein QA641_34650 [Bradyrhizobium sp. CB1650]|uniref:hypothetical protein n=1 Tax=Bradyrhizobium sp. CB1650 TaxID=3039153 RepID=UPI002435A7F7|nr:hypothetical protein [Bradyrhizobium sp. CB1650]WGD50689.1 hypothetical protein QA641_34650 [Bradyrhizobium sp. CB1650]